RLPAPGNPGLAVSHHSAEPVFLLLFRSQSVYEDERIDVPFPTTGKSQISFCDLLGHQPQRQDISAIGSQSQTSVFAWNHGIQQACLKEIVEILKWVVGLAIIGGGARSQSLTRQCARAFKQLFVVGIEFNGEHNHYSPDA